MLQVAIDSVADRLPPESELLILPSGPEAVASAAAVRAPDGARVLGSDETLDMVTNWNRCLTESRGELIHLLHDDDAIAPGFYQAILALARQHPSAAIYGTGFRQLGKDGAVRSGMTGVRQLRLAGEDAARFLLEAGRHCCGSIVLTRRAVEQQGLFKHQYAYCPDEEAYLRYASAGGLAFDPVPLYRERTHGEQGRFEAWKRADFAAEYMRARIDGAGFFGNETVHAAKESSAKRLISVAVSLALAGDHALASDQLDDLARCYPSCSRWRSFRLAKVGCRFRGVLRVAAARRKYLDTWRRMRTGSVTTKAG